MVEPVVIKSSSTRALSPTRAPSFITTDPLIFAKRADRPSFFCCSAEVLRRQSFTGRQYVPDNTEHSSRIWSHPFSRIFLGRGGTGTISSPRNSGLEEINDAINPANTRDKLRFPRSFQAMSASCPTASYGNNGIILSIDFNMPRFLQSTHRSIAESSGLPHFWHRERASIDGSALKCFFAQSGHSGCSESDG